MNQLDRLADSILQPINPAVTVVLGLYTVIWGLWLICPWWSVFAHGPAFAFMAKYAAETVWGGLAVACGLIIIRGAVVPVYWNIELGALVAFFFWLFISIMFFVGEWHSTGGLSAGAFAAYSALIWVNVHVNRIHFGYTEP